MGTILKLWYWWLSLLRLFFGSNYKHQPKQIYWVTFRHNLAQGQLSQRKNQFLMDIISFRTQGKTSFVVTWIEQTFFSTTWFNYHIDSMISSFPYALSRNSTKTPLSLFCCKSQSERICDDIWSWLLERTLELKRVKLCLSLNISYYKMCDFTMLRKS